MKGSLAASASETLRRVANAWCGGTARQIRSRISSSNRIPSSKAAFGGRTTNARLSRPSRRPATFSSLLQSCSFTCTFGITRWYARRIGGRMRAVAPANNPLSVRSVRPLAIARASLPLHRLVATRCVRRWENARPASVRLTDFAVRSSKQNPNFILQIANLPAQRRLGDVKFNAARETFSVSAAATK
jgi:hypothetical protein